jgi:pheganomycin biosynthesis PGM1-like protein
MPPAVRASRFHLIGALSEFGKLGVVCIGRTHERAEALYRSTIRVLDAEGSAFT